MIYKVIYAAPNVAMSDAEVLIAGSFDECKATFMSHIHNVFLNNAFSFTDNPISRINDILNEISEYTEKSLPAGQRIDSHFWAFFWVKSE